MKDIIVSLSLECPVAKELGDYATRLHMTNLEYIQRGIEYFNELNKRNLLVNQMRPISIIQQNSAILAELKNQSKNHLIL